MRAIKSRKREKQRGNKPFFLCSFIEIRHYIFRDLLKYILNICLISCFSVVYGEVCDTCDSKKIKTPVNARVYACARGEVIIGIFTIVKCPSSVNVFR